MASAPAFQFYANDFMDATRFMEANAVGLYVRCLCIQWTQGGLPNDLRMLAKGVGMDAEEFSRAWPAIEAKFTRGDDGLLRNSRLEVVRARQEEISSKRSEAGKAGAFAKANGQAKKQQRKVKVKEKVEREEEGEREAEHTSAKVHDAILWPSFDDFWNLYDKKRGRPNAEHEWAKIEQADREAIMQAVPAYTAANAKQYRKDPERYLKLRTWTDEVIDPTTPTNGTGSAQQISNDLDRIIAERYANR